jgi:tetratricopeptide (TPR) repeat protein
LRSESSPQPINRHDFQMNRLLLLSLSLALTANLCACQRPVEHRPELGAAATAALQRYAEHSPPDPQLLMRLVMEGQFEAFEAQAKAYEVAWSQVPSNEIAYQHVFEALQVDPPGLAERLDEWVAQRPSYLSLAARGSYRIGRGFQMRGTELARNTSRAQFEGMAGQHAMAREDLEAAVALKPDFTAAHGMLITIAQADGSRSEARQWLDLALAARPDAYMPRQKYILILLPRWGGSYEEMDAFTEGLEKATARNPLLWTLKGEALADRGHVAHSARDFPTMLQRYNEALSYGRRVDFLRERARAHWEMGNLPLALQDYQTCLTQSPYDKECLKHAKTLGDYVARVGA